MKPMAFVAYALASRNEGRSRNPGNGRRTARAFPTRPLPAMKAGAETPATAAARPPVPTPRDARNEGRSRNPGNGRRAAADIRRPYRPQ